MIYLERVASEITNVGLYDIVLQDIQKFFGKEEVLQDEVLDTISKKPHLLEDYKQINVEYNITNIHIKDIDTQELEPKCKTKAKEINKNLNRLREIEKYTLDFENSAILIIIFSIEFFVLFSVQYFIILLDLKDWQWELYGLFSTSALVAWWYAKKERRKYEENSKIFEEKYIETAKMLEDLENQKCIKKEDLIIRECDEHI